MWEELEKEPEALARILLGEIPARRSLSRNSGLGYGLTRESYRNNGGDGKNEGTLEIRVVGGRRV